MNAKGLEKLDQVEHGVIYANHQSNIDIVAMLKAIKKPHGYVAKKELDNIFLLSDSMRLIQCQFMDRTDVRQSVRVISAAAKSVKEGHLMVIFPEGTRTRKEDRRMNEFKAGAFKPATSSKSYVIPVMLNGTYRVLDKNIRKKQYYVDIKIFKPISYEEYKDLSTNDLSVHVQELISQELEQSFINNPAE